MRTLAFVAALAVPVLAHAQSEPRVIVVPYPGEARPDAGQGANVAPDSPPPSYNPPPGSSNAPPPPPAGGSVAPPPEPPKTIDAVQDTGEPPPPPPPDNLQPKEVPQAPISAMLDGHPREGAFLSGPGSFAFILHHTLMGLAGGLSTQLFPKVFNADPNVRSCDTRIDASACSQSARLAYLAGGLIGAGIGFASSAWWQFYNWMSETTAYYQIVTSIFGAMFGAGLMNGVTNGPGGDPAATAWGGLIGALAGAWLLTIIGGGELPGNKGALLVSGAYWAFMFAGVIVAIFATNHSSSGDPRAGVDVLMAAPAIGAGAMGLALLKFNPSTPQILRADLFGTAAGAVVLLISALVLGGGKGFTDSPVPYVLGGVAAAGAITIVSLLWAESAETPPPVTPGTPPAAAGAPASPKPAYKGVW